MSINQRGAAHILLPVIILLAAGVLVSTNIKITTEYGDNQVKGVLLAKDGGGSGSSGSDNRGKSQEVRIKQELRTNDQRIKLDIREDRTRVEIQQGSSKSKIEQKGNEFLITTDLDAEVEEATEPAEIEEEATQSAEEPEGEVVKELRAISKFPLRIDTSTNQLIMTKNGVERVLTVLPAHAVQNMLRAHLKKGLGPKFFQSPQATASSTPSATASATPSATASATPSATSSASPSAEPTSTPSAEPIAGGELEITILDGQISLEEDNGETVYKIPAKKHLKVFGFIPSNTDLIGYVSAESGELLREQQSLWARILDFLSP